jgi:hypothetical protein
MPTRTRRIIGEVRQSLIKMLKEKVPTLVIAQLLSLDETTIRRFGIARKLIKQKERIVAGHRTSLTNPQIGAILRRHRSRQSIHRIAVDTGVQWRTVRRIINLYKEYNPKNLYKKGVI